MPTALPRPSVAPALALRDLAVHAGVPPHEVPADWSGVVVSGVTLDSRRVHSGDLYAALPGSAVHGADFAAQAVAAGARAVLTDPEGAERLAGPLSTERLAGPLSTKRLAGPLTTERLAGSTTSAEAKASTSVPVVVVPDPRRVLGAVAAAVYGDPGRDLLLVGITGTNGKTTTAYLLDAAWEALGRTTGLVGTVETRIAGERHPSVRTTPESPDVHALLALMRERGVQVAAMEVSSHALELHRVDGVVYDVAVFTNLSQDHLDFHGTMERYFAAKAGLFTPEHARRGVVCVDDGWGMRLARESGVPVVTVGSSPERGADWTMQASPGEAAFVLAARDGQRPLHLRSLLPGDFNRVNTALAAVVLLECGLPAADVERALQADPQVPGRMERVDDGRPGHPRAVVDFAHTADAVASVLQALRPTTPGRLVVVLGAGGDRDRGKRPHMGRAAYDHADVVVVTDDNPRSEDPAAIRGQVLAGMPAHDTVLEVPGRGRAIRRAVALASGPQDTVLVVGKGHESGQEVAGVVHPFDDRVELRAALAEARA